MTPRRRPRREMTVEQFRECEATVVSVVRRFALEVSLTWTQRDDLVFAGMDEAGRMFLRWRSYGLKDKLGEYVSHGVALRISKEIARMRSPAYVPRDELADLDVDQHGWADVGDAYIEGLAGEEIDRDTETEAADIDARLSELAAGDVRVALLLDVERDGMKKDASARLRGVWHNRAPALREEGREVLRRDPVLRRLNGLEPLTEDVAMVQAICGWLCAVAAWERPAPRPFRRRAVPCNLWPRPRRVPSPPVVRHGRRSASLREGGCGIGGNLPRSPVPLTPSWPPSGAGSPRAGPAPPAPC